MDAPRGGGRGCAKRVGAPKNVFPRLTATGSGPSCCPRGKSPLGIEGVWEARRQLGLAHGSRGRAASLRAGKNIRFWNKLPGVGEVPCPLSLRRFKPNLGRKGWRDRHKECLLLPDRALPVSVPAGLAAFHPCQPLCNSELERGLAPDRVAIAFFQTLE